MSVIDFIAAHRRPDAKSEGSAALNVRGSAATAEKPRANALEKMRGGTLTASQFTRHITHIIEDEMRRSLKRHVDVIDPLELIDLAKMIAEQKAKYIGTTLAIASNRQPITDAELEQLKNFRVKIQELEAAHNELNEAIASQLVEVKGVVKE
ncbi:MAG: hypothetical protein K1X51_15690 [Rhodospirillaceae bacterium]|nr:hypothetical protein [Rhodospirillaceae bacterium]